MRLSEAIRLGAMMKPQITNANMRDRNGTCALGAALDACDVVYECGYGFIERTWPEVIATLEDIPCPDCGITIAWNLGGGVITHLNDLHKWTRERIADLVELHEIASIAPSEEVVTCDNREHVTG